MSEDRKRAGSASSRRTVLRKVGAASTIGAVGFAGCTGGGGEETTTEATTTTEETTTESEDTTTTTTSDSSGDEPVTVGWVLPYTGSYAGLAESGERGARLAIQQLNDEGGINGRTVEAVYEDTQLDPQTGQQKARKLIEQDGAEVLLGEPAGSVSLAIAEEAENANVPFFTMSSTSSLTMEDCMSTTFRYQVRMIETAAYAPYCVENFGSNVWVHFADYVWGQNTSGFWKDAMPDANVVGETKSEVGTSDYSTYVSQIQASDADWVFTALAGGDTVNFLKQAANFGLQEEVNVVAPLNAYQSVREPAGSAALNTYSVVSYATTHDSDRNQSFVSNFEEMHDLPPDNSAEVAYTDMRMFGLAANEAGTTNADDVISALESVEYEAPMGQASYRECDHQASRSVYFGEIVEESDYDWPGIDIMASKPGDEVMTPCEETGCSF